MNAPSPASPEFQEPEGRDGPVRAAHLLRGAQRGGEVESLRRDPVPPGSRGQGHPDRRAGGPEPSFGTFRTARPPLGWWGAGRHDFLLGGHALFI